MNQLTLYDICGDMHYIDAKLEDDGRVTVRVENGDLNVAYEETSHIYAWDSLVSFARMVIKQDKRIQMELEINEC